MWPGESLCYSLSTEQRFSMISGDDTQNYAARTGREVLSFLPAKAPPQQALFLEVGNCPRATIIEGILGGRVR